MARRYQKIQMLLPEIQQMLESGMSQREVAEALGLEGERPVHELLKRYRRAQRKQLAGISPKPKGRPRKDEQPPKQNVQKELERLRMENKLLLDFLSLTERM